jgi:GNAT superfamily N-acetyltransferase
MFTIRVATVADAQLVMDFIIELAVYEKARHEVVTSPEELARTLLGPQAKAHCLVCELDGRPIGYAVYFYNYSTWLGRNGIWLEDLYVTPAFRGRGAGKALLRHVAQIAVTENCGRVEWSVLDWNTPAIEFYGSMGATPLDEWTIHRVTGVALQKLAEQ